LFGFIVIATYTANLAAFLTVSRLDEPIKSLDDLSSQQKVKYAPHNGSAAMVYFQRMAEIEQKFYRYTDFFKENVVRNSFVFSPCIFSVKNATIIDLQICAIIFHRTFYLVILTLK
jgi:hypothetical protein